LRLTYFSSLRILFSSNYSLSWKMCECSLHRICVDVVATDEFCRSLIKWAYKHDLLPHTSLSFLEISL